VDITITCIGDSFTIGGELPLEETNQYSKLAWPTKLGALLNATVINRGMGGASNSLIIKRAITTTFEKNSDIIIVAWSNPVRSELVDEKGVFAYWPGRNTSIIVNKDREDFIKAHTVYETENLYKWAHRRWLRDIILLQNLFKAQNQKYIMIQSHGSQYYNQKWLVESDLHCDLANNIDTTFLPGWPLNGIVEWIEDDTRLPNGHPSEIGHQRVAEKLNEYIRNIGWVS